MSLTDLPTRRVILRGQCRGDGDQVVCLDLPVPIDRPVRLGREPLDPARPGYGSDLAFKKDKHISNFHATLTWDGTRLRVQRRPEANNPVYVLDRDDPDAARPADDFTAGLFDRFRIGNTVFTLFPDTGPIEWTVSGEELHQLAFVDPAPRIEALLALPGVISLAPDERRLDDELLRVVLNGIPRADVAAVVSVGPPGSPASGPVAVKAVQWRAGRDRALTPSRQLIHQAVRGFENKGYIWPVRDDPARDTPTVPAPGIDWAVCVPLMTPPDEGLYVAGRLDPHVRLTDDPSDVRVLDGDVKFARLAADIASSLRMLTDVQRREAFLRQMLSPAVRQAVTGRSFDAVVQPREVPVTVLFCDLRGSVEVIEQGQADLMGTLDRLSVALDAMTEAIVEQDGVIGDFQGDAAMGFWGWPLAQDDQVERACRAALKIRKTFAGSAKKRNDPLSGFVCGIGVAHGPAVAGRLGARDQAKIGVFGPAVNRAARLEAATKALRVPILIDAGVMDQLKALGGATWYRVRQVAGVRPQGVREPVPIGELLPPEGEPGPNLSEVNRRKYEAALERFRAGDWAEFRRRLAGFPADGPTEFVTRFIDQFPDGRPPDGWDGGIPVGK